MQNNKTKTSWKSSSVNNRRRSWPVVYPIPDGYNFLFNGPMEINIPLEAPRETYTVLAILTTVSPFFPLFFQYFFDFDQFLTFHPIFHLNPNFLSNFVLGYSFSLVDSLKSLSPFNQIFFISLNLIYFLEIEFSLVLKMLSFRINE